MPPDTLLALIQADAAALALAQAGDDTACAARWYSGSKPERLDAGIRTPI
jgi:hypothetical protein